MAIFESPDGGKTIYRRDVGSSTRVQVGENEAFYADLKETKLWGEIRRACKKDPALKELMDQVISFYLLKKNIP